MKMHRGLVLLAVVGVLVGVAPPASATIHNIAVGNNFYAPLGITAQIGDTVRWTWAGGVPHSVTATGASPRFFDSGITAIAGNTFDLIFTLADPPGAYPYFCQVHSGTMMDTITLVANADVGAGGFAPLTDQNNASTALSEVAPGEVYAVFNDFPGGGPGPSAIGWSFSLAGGASGSWLSAVKPPDAPLGFAEEWNPWVSAVPAPGSGFVMLGSQRAGPPWVPVANGIVSNLTPGGGIAWGAGALVFGNVPGLGGTWVDYPVVEVDDDLASPALGEAHYVWTEFTDATGGDADGNGNPYDDAGDVFAIFTASTSISGGGAPPYPLTTPPIALIAGIPVLPTSPGSARPAIEVVGGGGTPAILPGGAYVAFMDATAGVIFLDASPTPGAGGPWGALTGGLGPLAVPVPLVPIPPIIAPGVVASNAVTVAVDNSPLPCAGSVYLAWTDLATGDPDIFFSSSFDGGLTWTPPVRANQDPLFSGLDQWAPHMRVDDATGDIVITYYDRRNDPFNTLIEVWSSTSRDCGVTWTDCLISEAGPTPPLSNVPFPAAPYIGEYLGSDINPLNGRAYAWNDGRNGADQDIFFDVDSWCDTDADGVVDALDNCPGIPNPAQTDSDGDGFGAACDCNDTNPAIYPGAPETPDDGIDQDCDGADAVTCYVDADGDGFGDAADPGTVFPSGPCGPGFAGNNTDCVDTDAGINPGATEIPDDGIDQDCSGADAVTCYVDADGDGFGDAADPGTVFPSGPCGPGFAGNNTDCVDTDSGIHPGATEICGNGIDEDCDGTDATCGSCCFGFRVGDVDYTTNDPIEIDSGDLGLMVSFLFSPPGAVVLPCIPEADLDVSGGVNPVDSSDLGALVVFLFSPPGSVTLPACPP